MATTPSYTKAGVSIQCATPLYPAPRPQAAWPIPTAQSTGAQQSMLTLALVALAGQAVSGVTITSAILPSATATWTLYVQSYQGSPTTLPAPAAIPVTPVAGVISYTLTAPLAGATINCWLGSVDGISTITYPLATITTPVDPTQSTGALANSDKILLIQQWNQALQVQSSLGTQAASVGVSHAALDTAMANLSAGLIAAGAPSSWATTWPDGTSLYAAGIVTSLNGWWAAIAAAQAALSNAIVQVPTTGVNQINSVNTLVPADQITLMNSYNQELGIQSVLDASAVAVSVSSAAYDTAITTLETFLNGVYGSSGWTSAWPSTATISYTGVMTSLNSYWAAITSARKTLETNILGTKLPSSGLAANSLLLNGYTQATAATPSTIALRDGSGNLTAVNLVVTAGDGDGFAFWSGAPNIYGIQMSSATDATYGGRVAGETNSDYNIYFCMQGSAYRGWNFKNTGTGVVVAGIDGSGNGRFVGNLTANSISLPNSVQLTTLSNQNLGIETAYGTTYIGMLNSSYCHYNTPATYGNYFYQPITCAGSIASAAGLSGTTGSFSTSVATPTISADWHNVNGGADLTNYWAGSGYATTLWTSNSAGAVYEFGILNAAQSEWILRIPSGGIYLEVVQPLICDSTLTAANGTGGLSGPALISTYAASAYSPDALADSGVYRVDAPAGLPGGIDGNLLVLRGQENTMAQLYFDLSNNMYVRSGNPSFIGGAGVWAGGSSTTGGWATVYTSANILTSAAGLAATWAMKNAPAVVTTGAQMAALTGMQLNSYCWVTSDTTAGPTGTLYQYNGSSWVYAGAPNIVTGSVTAGMMSAGSIGCQVLAAGTLTAGVNIQSQAYTPSYGNNGVCTGWNISASPFITQLSATVSAATCRNGNQYQIVAVGTGTTWPTTGIVSGAAGTVGCIFNAAGPLTGTGTVVQVCASTMMEIGSNISVNGWLMGDLTGRACTAINAPGSMSPSWAAGTARVFYQGNNNPVYAGGTPDITCLIIKETSPVGYASGATGWRISWTLQPKQASSTYNSNLDAMRFARVTVFNSGAAGGEQFSMPLTDRLYADVSNDADPNNGMTGDFIYWRSGSSLSYTGSDNFNGYLLVTINNASGSSQQLFFESPGALGSGTIGSTAIAATSAGLAGYAVQIAFLGTTNWQLMGAPAGAVVGTTFTATQVGTGTGTLYLCFKSQIDNVPVGACSGGTCSLSGTTLALVTAPTTGSFQIGQTIVATGIPAGAYTVCLLSGTLGVPGSTYQMSASCTTESTESFTGNKTLTIGNVYMISTVGTTNWAALGAVNPAPGIVFTAIVAGAVTGTGTCVQMVAPPAGAVIACTTMTLGLWYSIVTLGTTTSAQWETTGAASSPTPTVGTSFQCIAEGVGTGTVVQTSAPPITSGGNSSGHSFGGGGGGGGD